MFALAIYYVTNQSTTATVSNNSVNSTLLPSMQSKNTFGLMYQTDVGFHLLYAAKYPQQSIVKLEALKPFDDLDWSTSRKSMVATRIDGLYEISLGLSARKILAVPNQIGIQNPSWSQDGQYIVFKVHEFSSTSTDDYFYIQVLKISDNTVQTVTPKFKSFQGADTSTLANDALDIKTSLPRWSSKADFIYFSAVSLNGDVKMYSISYNTTCDWAKQMPCKMSSLFSQDIGSIDGKNIKTTLGGERFNEVAINSDGSLIAFACKDNSICVTDSYGNRFIYPATDAIMNIVNLLWFSGQNTLLIVENDQNTPQQVSLYTMSTTGQISLLGTIPTVQEQSIKFIDFVDLQSIVDTFSHPAALLGTQNPNPLTIVPLCSPNPSLYRVWKITNNSSLTVDFKYGPDGDPQQLPNFLAPSETFTVRMNTNAVNKIAILISGLGQLTSTSTDDKCPSSTP